jgi:hypothetical protein
MNTKEASQTIAGSYRTVEIDGVSVLMEKVRDPDGKEHWVSVEYRLSVQREFEKRFANTETKPNDWKEGSGQAITPKEGVYPSDECPNTRGHLNALLVMTYGIPTDIITKKKLPDEIRAKLKGNRIALGEHIEIIKILKNESWDKVLPYVRALYLEG